MGKIGGRGCRDVVAVARVVTLTLLVAACGSRPDGPAPVVSGEAAVAAEHYRETYWHGRLAMVGARVEADCAVAASTNQSLVATEQAETRAADIVAAWETAVAQLGYSSPLLDAYTLGIDTEVTSPRRSNRAR